MPIVRFQSLPGCDVINMELVAPDGSVSSNRLLVDSGFTGESALVLAAHLEPMAHGYVDQANAAGALSGAQTRVVVQCRVPGLAFDEVLIAIAADITELALPPDVDGMAGLTFLRRFTSWGAERDLSGDWSFFLSDEVKEP